MWLRTFYFPNPNPFAAVNRSDFLKTLGLGALGSLIATDAAGATGARDPQLAARGGAAGAGATSAMSIGTWPFAEHTTRAALEAMQKGSSALDAVELGVKICEADPPRAQRGLGGTP